MPAPSTVQAQTIECFIDNWRKWTPSDLFNSLSTDCIQTPLPFNAKPPVVRTRTELEALFPILMSTLSDFQLTVHNVVHDSAHNKAALYCVTKATTPFGPYENEQAVFLWLSEDGDKVEKIEEMFDSAFMSGFLPRFHEYMAEKARLRQRDDGGGEEDKAEVRAQDAHLQAQVA